MEASSCVKAYAPGRTELAGNHTDHQGGMVIAATIDCGIALEVRSRADCRAVVESQGFDPFDIDLAHDSPCAGEQGTTAGLVRGVVAGLRRAGVPVEGFSVRAQSDIPAGSGLSSSAAFELALAAGLGKLFGDGRVELGPLELARIGQDAERRWFGKPCGLMDQLSIALGGINLIDFGAAPGADAEDGVSFEPIGFDFEAAGYALFLVDTHCDHSRYTGEYAQVASDMDDVAHLLGARRLCELGEEAYLARIGDVRGKLGDLAALRGLHYYHEMNLVKARERALRRGHVEGFLVGTRRSGASSAQYLQNVAVAGAGEQPAMLTLALADVLVGDAGAVRVHGGGFGGTVQAFCPIPSAERFAQSIDALLGPGSCKRYHISSKGAHAEWA